MISIFSTSIVEASPWPRPKGDGIIISRLDYFVSSFEDTNTPPLLNKFERFETNTYAEYGLTNNILISGKFVYGLTQQQAAGETISTASGITEVELGAQYTFRRTEKSVTSARIAYVLPPNAETGTRDGFASDGNDLDLSLLYGRSLTTGPVNTFISGLVSYRRRFGSAADQVRTQATIGAEPSDRWLLLGEVFTEISLQNNEPDGADFDIIKIQPSVVWKASKAYSIQLGLSQEITGRNINLGRTVFLGLWYRF